MARGVPPRRDRHMKTGSPDPIRLRYSYSSVVFRSLPCAMGTRYELFMTTELPSQPLVVGEEAFRSRSRGASESRTAQLQCMTLFAAGEAEQAASIAADAEVIGTPGVEAPDFDSNSVLLESYALDYYTSAALNTKGGKSSWQPGAPSTATDRIAMRRRIEEGGGWLELAYLLNLSMTGPSHLERVASAQALDALSRGRNWRAREVLANAESTQSSVIAAIAATSWPARTAPPAPKAPGGPPPSWDPYPFGEKSRIARSVALHGTWARVAPERWYAPGHPLHSHIAAESSTNLYVRDDYPRWSGGYTADARRAGAEGLQRWVVDRKELILGIDTIYAHSHGGNVALSAAAMGLKIELLVLLHVPPRWRPDAEWQAIQNNVNRVLVYRTKLDAVVLADMIRAAALEDEPRTLSQRFDQTKLHHVDTEPHPIRGPWFSHGHFTTLKTWTTKDIAKDVKYYRESPPMSPAAPTKTVW